MESKFVSLIVLSTLFSSVSVATEMHVEKVNGEVVTFDVENVEEVYFEEKSVLEDSESPLKFNVIKPVYNEPAFAEVVGTKSTTPDSVYVIPEKIRIEGTVYDVKNISNIAFSGHKEIKKIVIPPCVKYIGDGAFKDCINLQSANITESITIIYTETFSGCESLSHIDIPSTVNTIQSRAFYKCKNLSEFTISANLTGIGDGVFSNSGITNIKVDAENPNFVSEDGVLYSKDMTDLIQFPSGFAGEFIIKSGVKTIEASAFTGSEKLTGIVIPEGVTKIPENCFYSCIGLKKIEMPESLTEIGDYALSYCTGLTNIEIPSGVTAIGRYAFWGDNKLTTVKIPSSVTEINSYAFRGCKNLEVTIDNTEGAVSISSGALDDCKSVVYLK